jgi:hypothetical protein
MRRQKLVLAEFQLRLVLLVAAAAGVAAGVQALMLDQAIGIVAKTLPNDASLLEAELPGLMARWPCSSRCCTSWPWRSASVSAAPWCAFGAS